MYALVLSSDLENPKNWICHCLTPELSDIHELPCFPPEELHLPKSKHAGTVLPEIISKRSCYDGNTYSCQIIQLTTDINITQFNL